MNSILYSTVDTPFGEMGIALSKKGLCRIYFPEEAPFETALAKDFPNCAIINDDTACKHIKKQIVEYFSGRRTEFDLELDLRCPPFYKKALNAVHQVPFGKTASYKDIAVRAGNPSAVRAAGSANANNPIPIVIPCHRILNTGGGLGGYGGKLQRKAYLLELEGSL